MLRTLERLSDRISQADPRQKLAIGVSGSENGKFLFVYGKEQSAFFNMTKEEKTELNIRTSSVCFSPDSKLLFCADQNQVRIFSTKTLEQIQEIILAKNEIICSIDAGER